MRQLFVAYQNVKFKLAGDQNWTLGCESNPGATGKRPLEFHPQVARLANNGSSASTEILQQAKAIFLVGPILTEEMVDMLFAIFTDQFKYWHYYHL